MLPSAIRSVEDIAPGDNLGAPAENFISAHWLSRQILAVLLHLHLHQQEEQRWCLGVQREPHDGRAGLGSSFHAGGPGLCFYPCALRSFTAHIPVLKILVS